MTTEQAEQSAQETAEMRRSAAISEGKSLPDEPLTADQAQTEIARLQGDPDFLKVYLSRGNDDSGAHKESIGRMTKLFALAHPTEPMSETPRLDEMVAEREKEQQQGQQPLSEGEQAEAEVKELDDAQQIMQDRFGDDWQEEMSGVRDSIQEIGGDVLFDHLQSNYGSDPAVMGQLMELQRENDRYPIVAALAELVDQNMTPNRAALELERRLADPEFIIRYTNSSEPGHKEALAVARALHIAADPPAFITSGAKQ